MDVPVEELTEGFLEKKGPTRFSPWKVRFFRLLGNELTYAKGENTEPLGRIVLDPTHRVCLGGGSAGAWSFEVVTPGRTYQLRSQSIEARDLWVDALQRGKERAVSLLTPLGAQIQGLKRDSLLSICAIMASPGIGVPLKAKNSFGGARGVDWVMSRFSGGAGGEKDATQAMLGAEPMTRRYACNLLNRFLEAQFLEDAAGSDSPYQDAETVVYRFAASFLEMMNSAPPGAGVGAGEGDAAGAAGGANGKGGYDAAAAGGSGNIAVQLATARMRISEQDELIAQLQVEKNQAVEDLKETATDMSHMAEQLEHAEAHIGELNDLLKLRPRWVPDDERPQCYLCAIEFSFFKRRHHCRMCGEVSCADCSAHKVPLLPGSPTRVRVCNACALSAM